MKRGICICLLAALLLTGCGARPEPTETTAAPTETTAAVETTEETVPEITEAEHWDFPAEEISVRVSLGEKDLTERLTDSDRSGGMLLELGSTLTIESDELFEALYLEWDAVPWPYVIAWEGGQLEWGTEGFQHDYIRLPEAVMAVTLTMKDSLEPILCRVRAFTEGLAPEGVQDWEGPCDQADILVFPTHSDDDVLFFGALMSYYAIDMKLDVQTAFMTRHYDAPERDHERLDGLWEAGVRHYPILGQAPDLYSETLREARYQYASYDILGWQVEQIRRFRPRVIVGHDLNGEYGHGGHMLNASTLKKAVELAADETFRPEPFAPWDTPKLYFHLYPENQIELDVDTPLQNDPRGRTPFQVAVDAYDHHKSQHKWSFRVTREDSNENCVQFGLYRSLVGEDTGADIMENIGYG